MALNVLVVDDDEMHLKSFVALLEAYEINVVGTAEDGRKAVENFMLLKPDLVFLDIIMPEYDGVYALEKIRQIKPDAKVVMVTGAGYDDIHLVEKWKPSAIIHKPYEMNTILHILKEELGIEIRK